MDFPNIFYRNIYRVLICGIYFHKKCNQNNIVIIKLYLFQDSDQICLTNFISIFCCVYNEIKLNFFYGK